MIPFMLHLVVGGTVVVAHFVADDTILVTTTSHAATVNTRGFPRRRIALIHEDERQGKTHEIWDLFRGKDCMNQMNAEQAK